MNPRHPLSFSVVAGLLILLAPQWSEAQETPSTAPDDPPEVHDASSPEKDSDDTPNVETDSTIDETEDRRGWKVGGDIRPIIDGLYEKARDGSSENDRAPGFRARIGASWGATGSIRLGARLAGAGFAGDFNPEFIRLGAIPDQSDLEGGQFTLDQLYVHWKRVDRFDLAVGRLQTRFTLRGGVFAKSLDRNDSSNVNVTWTDGLHATLRSGGWVSNLVVQRNSAEGTGSIRRDPLDFDDGDARNTYFLGFENQRKWGPVVQRAFDISYLPSSLLKDGVPDGRRTDYWGMVGRLAFRWPQRTEGLRLRAGFEVGYAPETPTSRAVLFGGSGDSDGLAWDVVVSAMDFAPGHSIGFNYAQTGAGWLLSPQFRPNEEMIEIRYQWRSGRLPLFEARVRRRQDLHQRVLAERRRSQYDFFLRLTWQFTIVDR